MTERPRILWLALADARGHLMRAQLVRRLLSTFGVDVDIVTTSAEGAEFVAGFGASAEVLSRKLWLEYDEGQNLQRRRTHARTWRYLVSPGRCLRDLRWLERRASAVDLVVNDSFHPALIVAPLVHARLTSRLVHVYGENIRRAVEETIGNRWLSSTVTRALERSFACIEHTFEDAPDPRGAIRLPPIVAAPRRSRAEVRASLGIRRRQRLAVVYLNPHFRAPALADAIEGALRRAGHAMVAVGEGHAGRPGWVARDSGLTDVVAAADLYLSAPGMGALAQARTFGTPFLALVTGQPEQRHNVGFLRDHPARVVDVGGGGLETRLGDAVDALSASRAGGPADPAAAVAHNHARWAHTLLSLINSRRKTS